jgi:tetratricopeptide (TPR) repeat protein
VIRRAAFGTLLFASLSVPAGRLRGEPVPLSEPSIERLRAAERGPHPPSPQEYARELNDLGRIYHLRGDYPRAIELLSEAVARDPDNGVALANLTLAYLRNGDFEFAEFYLDLARHTEGRENPDPRFYVSLGEIYDAQNRTQDAVTAWEQALRLGSTDPDVRRRLARAQKEWAYAHGQGYFSGERFEYFFDPSISEKEVRQVDEFLESTADSLSEFFFVASPPHSTVILYAGRRYFHLVETPDWVGGFYDGKIRVPIESGGAHDESFLGLLRHELAHAFLDQISRGRAPAWLQEGLAQYVEGRRVSAREIRSMQGRMPASFFDEAEFSFRQRTDRDQALTAYLLALSYVQHLIRIAGPGAAVCIVADLGQGRPLSEAFRREFGRAPSALEASWRASLESERSP